MKLELKDLAPYLPFKLNCLNQNLPDTEMVVEELIGISNHITWSGVFNAKYGSNHIPICGIKPILRPLSDLTEDLLCISSFFRTFSDEDNVGYICESKSDVSNQGLSYSCILFLIENHFDVFGLIEKGLAIDINTI